ncbi:putative disease resistance RPP13-like protein 1 [Vicia villosa]|uniref:putative disease resistance RPP13-like protein 1 n=1 Tax=Vicia villosa TaxID=3911 RepID=UPI00273C8E7A|nr:putative disease resistance RPP13-like protein 1 [Vicia villosa]
MAATALVGSAFLSATVEDLLLRLASSEFIDYITSSKLNLLKLTVFETSLLTLNSVLPDAERKQFFNPAVKQWMDELYVVISDADDLIDEVGYDLMQCKVENAQPKHDFTFDYRLKFMNLRLQRFVQRIDFVGLQSVNGRVSCRMRSSSGSSSVLNESFIVGREDDQEKLMNMLLSDTGTNLDVVAIFGVGGVGKTTLAELVYNDKEVNDHFDLKMWIRVSEDFDIARIIRTLLTSVCSLTYDENDDLDYIRFELKQKLNCRRFLFVLDDLWNVGYNDWHELVAPLVNGKLGSRVIITTRQEKVAEVVHTFPIHKLEPLSDEDGWSLLSKHAFGSKVYGGSEYPDLEAIGRKIARKCLGLPLAAKTLGGHFSSTVDLKDWISILISNIWKIPDNNILPSLLLSYQCLPSHLKRCFAYCSVFPKGYSFNRKQMILLWMAEGFLEHCQDEKAPEEVGDDYFVELLSRSFIQQLKDDSEREKFVLHDLLYDLAEIVSGKSCCKLECSGIMSKKVQHLSYIQHEYDTFKKFEIFHDFESLRSFLPICIRRGLNYLSRKVVDDLLPTLRNLRVLSLSHHKNFTMLPGSIYNLLHLRYLDLSHTDIKSLPESICHLYYLQTLKLSMCLYLTELPVDIGKLINLRHLDISNSRIKKMPMQIVRLENLQTLSVFRVGKQEVGLSVRELGKFPNIQGKLYIGNLCNVINVSEACDANLKNKELIDELELCWKEEEEQLELFWEEEEEERPHDSQTQTVVLDGLQPSINLKKLIIGSYRGTSFPSWLGDSSFSNMVYLRICYCEYCVTLPSLGQLPSLIDLSIDGMSILETIGPEFYGMSGGGFNSSFQPFPSLEHLKFSYMSNWKEWHSFGGSKFPFPRLKTLKLDNCPKLEGHLPSHLPSIEKVQIHCCNQLLATLSTLQWLSSVKSLDVVKSLDIQCSDSIEWSLSESNSACLLQRLIIWNFRMMLSLPKSFMSPTCLQHLELHSIPSLLSFPDDGLPTSLQSLELHSLPSLLSFPDDGLPTSLQSLRISDCENLAFLPPETWSKYTSLVSLVLTHSCDALTSFPLNGFPMLQRLDIANCGNLQSLFISEIYSHTCWPSSLQSLDIFNCNALISLPQRMDTLIALESLHLTLQSLPCYEGASLPPNLRSIYIKIESLRTKTFATGWGLQNLSALSVLDIRGDGIVNTLLKEQLLPVSLVSLSINFLSKRKSLPGNGLRHLSSLEKLRFHSCSKLGSLPENMFPSYLKSLDFSNCPKLKSLPDKLPSSLETLKLGDCQRLGSLPKDGLPSSLKQLSISECRLLKAKYKNQKGEHWSSIAHIPVIEIDDELTI